jgi:hypothetical protein
MIGYASWSSVQNPLVSILGALLPRRSLLDNESEVTSIASANSEAISEAASTSAEAVSVAIATVCDSGFTSGVAAADALATAVATATATAFASAQVGSTYLNRYDPAQSSCSWMYSVMLLLLNFRSSRSLLKVLFTVAHHCQPLHPYYK